MIAWLVSLAVLASTPSALEQFPEEAPSHVFLVVERASGRIIRADDAEACENRPYPAGEAIRILAALTALEDAVLRPEDTVPCGEDCWARGGHGSPGLLDALARSCDSYFRHVEAIVSRTSLERRAVAAGFDVERGTPPEAWGATARDWVELWSALASGGTGRLASTAPALLAAGGLAVSSPRGSAHTLLDPTAQTRALAGGSEEGAWVSGTFRADERHSWVFALFVRAGTTPLATTRAASLLRDTLRVYRESSDERGGTPLPPLEPR